MIENERIRETQMVGHYQEPNMKKVSELTKETEFLKEFMVNPKHRNIQSVYDLFNVVENDKRLFRCLIQNFLYYYSKPKDTVNILYVDLDKLYSKLFDYYAVTLKNSLDADVIFVNNLSGDKRIKSSCRMLGSLTQTMPDTSDDIRHYGRQGYGLQMRIMAARRYLEKTFTEQQKKDAVRTKNMLNITCDLAIFKKLLYLLRVPFSNVVPNF